MDIISRSIQKKPSKYDQVSLSPRRFWEWHARWSLCGFSILSIQFSPTKTRSCIKRFWGKHLNMSCLCSHHFGSIFLHFRGSTFQNLTSLAPLGIPNRSGHAGHTATLWSTTLRFLSERLNCNDGSRIRVASHCWILLQIHLYIYIWCICNLRVVFLGWLCDRGRLQPTEFTLPWKLFLLALPWNKIGAKKSESGWEWVTRHKKSRDGIWIWRFENHSLYIFI